mmetsp:Transcript_13148/g.19129  ORF Transcript_13148/g.19129 Transcript_13148/m.19129 type:complete len:85 (+) Transcript_13148:1283-1537(+)
MDTITGERNEHAVSKGAIAWFMAIINAVHESQQTAQIAQKIDGWGGSSISFISTSRTSQETCYVLSTDYQFEQTRYYTSIVCFT